MSLSFYRYDYFARWSPFYEPLRGREDLARVLDRAAQCVAEFVP